MIELFKDRTSPSIEDTVKINGAAFDLTGCGARFRMRPELSTTLEVDAVAAILQTGTDPNFVNKGVWRWDPGAGDVDTAGFYVAWLTVTLPGGAEQDTDEFVVIVREHGSSIDLCSVAEVKAYIKETTSDYDDEIAQLVAAASRAMLRRSRRELRAFSTNPSLRVFDLKDEDAIERVVPVGDLASFPTQIQIFGWDGTLSETVDLSTVVALPRVRESWQPLAELKFLAGRPTSARLYRGYTLEVTAAWGFPSVPDDIRIEAKKTAAAWLARDVKRTGKVFKDREPGFSSGGAMHELPLSAEQVATAYRIPSC